MSDNNTFSITIIELEDRPLEFFRPISGDKLTLENTAHLDGIIVGGSASSANDDEPWMLELGEFIRQVAGSNSKLKMVGVCSGHQLICKALGGTVRRGPRFVFGADKVRIAAGADSPLTATLRSELGGEEGLVLNMLQSHGDEVSLLPSGAVRLGTSDRCENEVVLIGPHILTVQCHPDLTVELMMRNIWPYLVARGAAEGQEEGSVREEMEALDTDRCLKIIRMFLSGQ